MPIPASFILDDGGPVHPSYFLHPEWDLPLLVSNDFTRDYFAVLNENGVKGKFSVLAMPTCQGRLDESINYVPESHRKRFIREVREGVLPNHDLCPEILTHHAAYDLKTKRFLHIYEDVWMNQASSDEITDYISLALKILKNVGLTANGVTSPWSAGIKNEKAYVEGIGRAHWRVHRRKLVWYFLHCFTPQNARWPWVARSDKETGQKVISIPANTGDPFTRVIHKAARKVMKANVEAGVNRMLSKDGRHGQIRELVDTGKPITILTHWQCLYSCGHATGLHGLETLVKRMNSNFGDAIQWMRCSELAKLTTSNSPE